MKILVTLALWIVLLILSAVYPGFFLIAFLAAVAVELLGAFAKRPGLLLTLLGISALFGLVNGDDDDCDL